MKKSMLKTMLSALPVLAWTLAGNASEAAPTHLNIFHTIDDGIQRVCSTPLSEIDSITFLSRPDGDTYGTVRISVKEGASGQTSEVTVDMDNISEYSLSTNVPTLRIVTEPPVAEITSKKDYLQASVEMDGFGHYDDLEPASAGIRGRGNSTWGMPKKPYRLKFDKKRSLCGLASAKNFVLIANYIDATHLRNAMALRLSQLLGMPFANHSVPVNVELNGIPKGAYMLSEKQGIGKGSVNIDETTGIMWELDTAFDEDWRFTSPAYGLPVMVADPDPLDIVPEGADPESWSAQWFDSWRADFVKMEENVKLGKPDESIDMTQAVDYIMVNLLSGNNEVDWPKSVKLFKPDPESAYILGPVWDFDWGFGYRLPATRKLFIDGEGVAAGCRFFIDIAKTPQFKRMFEERWEYVKTEILPFWLEYMDEYAAAIRVSALQDGELWPDPTYSSADFDNQVAKVREWIAERVSLIDADPNRMIY